METIRQRKMCAALLSLGAVATVCPAAGLEITTAGDISYVSGGVGASEQEELEQVEADYNLRLLFAVTGSGAFLAEEMREEHRHDGHQVPVALYTHGTPVFGLPYQLTPCFRSSF
jgi:hypothetical protein